MSEKRWWTAFFHRLCALLILLPLAGCSPLALFNGIAIKDGGSQVERALPYGSGPRQRLDIYMPSGMGESRHPVLFFIYGGSWDSGSRGEYAFVGRAFAARGFTTVIADYRLVPDVTYPEFIEDNAAALAWVWREIGRYGGDRDRLYVAGHSAGAYNAVMLAVAPRFLRAEGLSPDVIDGVAALSGPYDFLPLDEPETIAAFAAAPDLRATQPVRRDVSGAPPMLLIHGAADDLVMPRNSVALAAHLRRAGRPVELQIYDGADHADTLLALSRPFRDDLPVLEDVVAFFSERP